MEGRRRHGLREYIRRWVARQGDRFRHGVGAADVTRALRQAGVEAGSVIAVHSSLTRLGYVDGGAEGMVEHLLGALGPNGTLLMPSFPMTGPMAEYLDAGVPLDIRKTPSRSGALTEAFRLTPGVRRSVHPTNPVCATGPAAEGLLARHDESITPFGPETPFGRLAARDDTFIVMMETHVQTFIHYLQERISLPTLYSPGERTAGVIDEQGVRREVRTKVTRGYVAFFLAVPGPAGQDPEWIEIRDAVVIYPGRREREIRALGYSLAGYPRAWEHRGELTRKGILRVAPLGKGEVGVLHVRPFVDAVTPELAALVERYRHCYDPDRLSRLGKPIG